MSNRRKAKVVEISEQELQDRLAGAGDQRIDPRLGARFEVDIPLASWDAVQRVYTTNISKGGLMVRVAPPVKMPAGVDITLELPDGSKVTLHSEVRHVAPNEDSSEVEVGVQFKQLDDQTRQVLESAVNALHN